MYTVVSCSHAPLRLCQLVANKLSTASGAACVQGDPGIQQAGWGQSVVCLSGPGGKTPPRALIATMRSSPEALSNGGLAAQAGNLLLFIDQ